MYTSKMHVCISKHKLFVKIYLPLTIDIVVAKVLSLFTIHSRESLIHNSNKIANLATVFRRIDISFE